MHAFRSTLLLAALSLSCGAPPNNHCDTDAACEFSTFKGRCFSTWCALPDDVCPSGWRYHETAQSGLANVCVPRQSVGGAGSGSAGAGGAGSGGAGTGGAGTGGAGTGGAGSGGAGSGGAGSGGAGSGGAGSGGAGSGGAGSGGAGSGGAGSGGAGSGGAGSGGAGSGGAVLPSGYVMVAPGSFTMGSPANETGRFADEVAHDITLSRRFLIKETEVTQTQWLAVMGTSPSGFSSCGGDCPVENVTWFESVAFCNELSRREAVERCYADPSDGTPYDASDAIAEKVPTWTRGPDCLGYRLPTEAEWEYAARASSGTAFHTGRILATDCSIDQSLDLAGWYCGNASSTTHRVAGKQANLWGLFDVHGNTSEWVWDWLADYPASTVIDPLGPAMGQYRIYRGGSWSLGARFCRSARRNPGFPTYRNANVGLRPCRTWP